MDCSGGGDNCNSGRDCSNVRHCSGGVYFSGGVDCADATYAVAAETEKQTRLCELVLEEGVLLK